MGRTVSIRSRAVVHLCVRKAVNDISDFEHVEINCSTHLGRWIPTSSVFPVAAVWTIVHKVIPPGFCLPAQASHLAFKGFRADSYSAPGTEDQCFAKVVADGTPLNSLSGAVMAVERIGDTHI